MGQAHLPGQTGEKSTKKMRFLACFELWWSNLFLNKPFFPFSLTNVHWFMNNFFRPFCILASDRYYDVVYMAKIGRNDPCLCGSGKKYKHCCYQKNIRITPTLKKEAKFTLDDGSKIKHFARSVDSIPVHNHLGLRPNIPKEEMINLCVERIYTILKRDKVDMLVDLVDKTIEEMNIIPNLSYGDIGTYMEQDDRFEIYKMQVCSLKGTDPVKLIMEKLSI